MKTKTRPINFWLIAVSLLFFFNPNIIVIDFLPDFIGYILLCAALTRLADLSDTVGEAVNGFKKMIFIDAGKWLALLWIFGMSVESEKTSSMLLWTFVFCVLELIFALPAFLKLFGGLLEIANFYDGSSILGTRVTKKGIKRRANYTETARLLTVIFVAVKAVFAFLPELADLGNTAYDESSGFLNIYRYIGVMRGIAFVIVLAVGIAWTVKMIRYFWRINSDSAFVGAISSAYEQKVLPKKGVFANKYIKTGFVLLIAGAVLSIDFRLENINMIPDVISGAVFLGFAVYMSRRMLICKKETILSASLYLIAAAASDILGYNFFSNYTFLSVLRSEESARSYFLAVGAVAVQGILLLVFGFFILKNIRYIIKEHTGFVCGRDNDSPAEQRQTAALHKELFQPVKYAAFALVAYVATDLLNVLQVYCYAYFEAEFGYFNIINIVVGAVFVGLTVKALWDIQDAVKIKYMLE